MKLKLRQSLMTVFLTLKINKATVQINKLKENRSFQPIN